MGRRNHDCTESVSYTHLVATATTSTEIPDAACVQPDELINLPLYQGRLTARLPEGKWRILRMGHTATGHVNATAGGGKGLECDKNRF